MNLRTSLLLRCRLFANSDAPAYTREYAKAAGLGFREGEQSERLHQMQYIRRACARAARWRSANSANVVRSSTPEIASLTSSQRPRNTQLSSVGQRYCGHGSCADRLAHGLVACVPSISR